MSQESREDAARRALQGLAHELRAPLQSLLGYVDLLRDGSLGPLNGEQQSAVESVAAAAEKILAVTGDVLQVARIAAGRDRVIVGEVALDALLAGEIDAVRPLATAEGLELALECPAGLRTVSDGAKIARIVTNLLTNALKFTPRGGRVLVRAAADGDGVRIEVSDDGAGIPAGKHDAVFEEYVRLDRSREGTGLGLPIARRLAEMLGGALTLDSAEGCGATFRLRLPGS